MWTREPHRNALSKQEYRPAQQNREIKSPVDLKRRDVRETRREKLFEYILPLFLLQCAKSQGDQPRAKVGQGSTRACKNIQGKTSIDWKMAIRTTIDRKLPIKASANPQIFSCCREILRFGTHPRKVSLLQFFVSFSSVLVGLTSEAELSPEVTSVLPNK